jgi:hypothetical protein
MFEAILLVVAGFGLILYSVSRLNYVIDDRYLRLRLGPIPLRKVPMGDIVDAVTTLTHWSESWTNTIYPPTISKKAVTVYRKSGGFGRIVLTPDNPEAFIERLKSHPRFGGRAELAASQRGGSRLNDQRKDWDGVDRRSGKDRRSGTDRRKPSDPGYKGPERRSGRERRSGTDRRKNTPSH